MSLSRQMPRVAGVAALGAAVAGLATQPTLRALLLRLSGLQTPGGGWRLLAVFLLLSNLKNLPLVWHFRFFSAFFYQLYFQADLVPPNALFQPVVSTTRTPLMECDYNCHKSNSTYFSDMDISRTHLFTAVLGKGIRKSYRMTKFQKSRGDTSGGPSPVVALGGVSCFFKREIGPYQKFEMWTRLLCWDRKWFYMVTHLVKPGVAKPPQYTLQPWRKAKKTATSGEEDEAVMREKLNKAVYATAISRYVVKKGRMTISPEEALIHADMVPPKPEGWVFKGDVSDVADDVVPAAVDEDEWNWDVIETERRRGLRFAEMFTQLDGLHDFFDGAKNGALARYPDVMSI